MFEFEACEVFKIKEFTFVNDCFKYERNEEIGHYGQTLNRIEDRDIKALIDYETNKLGKLAAPTPEHYVPLIYSMALADDKDEIRQTFTDMLPGFSNRSFIIESLN